MADTSEFMIEIDNLTKTYGPTIANSDISFSVRRGSVHALLGENGAGKSTTMKLLSGLIQPDAGSIKIGGNPVVLRSPREAHAQGIQTAYQELSLIKDLSVLDNMLLPRGPTNPAGMLKRGAAARAVVAHFNALHLVVDPHAMAGGLDLATRQKIEIARALFRQPRILLLDEPTSALSGEDVAWLGALIEDARKQGITVLFISHRLPEVRAFCDTLTILRNGQHVQTTAVDDVTDDEVVELIIGRSVESTFPPRVGTCAMTRRDPVLQAHGLCAGQKLRDAEFDLHPGEILGIAGLQGMGQKDLFAALFGDIPIDGGEMSVDGQSVHLRAPYDALHPSISIGLVPEERKTQGLFLKLNGTQNASLPVVERFTRGILLDRKAEDAATKAAFDAVEVSDRAQYTQVGAFSGGNQQKIAIAKWLVAQSRILLLFDPTRGIDVGTKHQLFTLIREFASAGGALLFHSTEIPELVHLSDRVGVLYEGRIVRWLAGDDLTETALMEAALGGTNLKGSAA
jgi:ribose transport system ATP-binding protein